MAYFTEQRRDAIDYLMQGEMAKPEKRVKPAPALMLALMNKGGLIPQNEEARVLGSKAEDQQTVNINIMNKQSMAVAAARTYNHTGSVGDGSQLELSFTTSAVKFKYSMKQGERLDSAIGTQLFANALLDGAIALHEKIETDFITFMTTNKSQVATSPSASIGVWNGTDYIFEVAAADSDRFIQKMKAFMRKNKYNYGGYQAIFDQTMYDEASYIAQQGGGNQTNLGWQLNNMDFMESIELAPDAAYSGTSLILPAGSFSALSWIPQMNRRGFGDPGQNGGEYSFITDPLGSGLQFAVHMYYEGADNESTYGNTQDVDVQVEMSVDMAPFHALLSTANASPIFEASLLK